MPEDHQLALVVALKAAIQNSGMLRKDIAAAAGVSASQVSRLMNDSNITLHTAARLFEYLRPTITFDTPPPTPPADAPPPAGKPAKKRK